MIVGVLLGILVGVLPGLGAPNGVSLLLPLTFSMDPGGGDHPADLHVLGGAVRRLDDVDTVQHSRRTVVGRDHLRRLSDGATGARHGSTELRVPVGRLRRIGRRDPDHAAVGLGHQVRAEVLVAGILRRLLPGVRELRRLVRCAATEDGGVDRHRLRAGGGRHGFGVGQPAPDFRFRRIVVGRQLPRRGHRSVRHRRTAADDRGRAEPQGPARPRHAARRLADACCRCRDTG